MKQKITVADYAQRITEALPQGVLLNTNGDKHNAMVIGWGGLGTCWSVPTFTSGKTGTPSLSLTKPAYSQSVFPWTRLIL